MRILRYNIGADRSKARDSHKPRHHVVNRKSVYIFALISCVVIALSVTTIVYLNGHCLEDYVIIPTVVISVGCSMLASAFYSYSIDIQREVEDFKTFVISAFTSDEFLQKLDDERLSGLRAKIIGHLNESKYPNMQRGLIDLDRNIFDMLKMPYYKIFRENFLFDYGCDFQWGPDVTDMKACIRKTHKLEYVIKSPQSETVKCEADLGLKKHLFCPDKGDLKNLLPQILKLRRFVISVDGGKNCDIVNRLRMSYSDMKPGEDYNMCVNIHLPAREIIDARTDEIERDGDIPIEYIRNIYNNTGRIPVEFNKEVKVIVEYDIVVPIDDVNYTNRLKYPAKSYRIDCFCKELGTKFYGQLLGTFTKQCHISTNSTEDSISIESFDWLLPRNGVYVVLIKNESVK